MTLDNLKYGLYLNNLKLIKLIDDVQESVNTLAGTDISDIKKTMEELQALIAQAKEDIENLNDTTISGINQKITDIQESISKLEAKDAELKTYVDTQIAALTTQINSTIADIQLGITSLTEALEAHASDTVIHVTSQDKEMWNATLGNAKSYAKSLFDGVTNFTVNIVEALPDEPIPMVIYFIANGNGDTNDYYDEYMYIGDKWEKIGDTYVNLEPYALKADVAATLLNYLTISDFTTAVDSINKNITAKADKQWVIDNYTSKTSLTAILLDYLTVESFNARIADYATIQSVKDVLDKYINADDLKANYALKTELHSHDNKSVIDKLSDTDGKLLYNGAEIATDQITVSQETKNAIQTKTDGIYVEDKTQDIANVNNKINNLAGHKHFINQELEYGYFSLPSGYREVAVLNDVIPFENIMSSGINSENGYVFLKAGKIYNISCDLYIEGSNFSIAISITDKEKNKTICSMQKNTELQSSDNHMSCVYCPDNDCNIFVSPTYVGGTGYIYNYSTFPGQGIAGYLIIQEIGREVHIDPVDYINEKQGLEDTPVGNIISFMGVVAPKHYLTCDGAVYNILEYPILANHILDNFGKYNFFGGNGIDTFAVPDLRNEFLRGYHGTAEILSDDIGKHQEPTKHVWFSHLGDANLIQYRANQKLDNIAAMDIDSGDVGVMYRNTQKFASSDIDKEIYYNPQRYTSRPTNTAVNYCIKYEPTYFMNVTNTTNKELVGRTADILFTGTTSTTGNYKLTNSVNDYDELFIVHASKGEKDSIKTDIYAVNMFNDKTLLALATHGNVTSSFIRFRFDNDLMYVSAITLQKIISVTGIKYEKIPEIEQVTDLDIELAISDVITLLNSDGLPEVSPELQAAISDTINLLNK